MGNKSKKTKRIPILVYIYNSFKDPLFQGLLYRYINIIADMRDEFEFHIITFEQEKYPVSPEERVEIKAELEKKHIYWYPQRFHTGRFLLFKKAYDMIQAFFSLVRIQFRHRPKTVLAFANIAGSFSYILSKIFRWKVMVFSYEPHSEFLQQLGYWSEKSMKYRILNSVENRLGIHGDYIITGTKHMVKRLNKRGSKAKIYRLPTSVDHNQFQYKEEAATELRKRLGIEGKKVLIYTGKFGDLYYKEEIFELAQTLYEKYNELFFIFLTGHDPKELGELFEQYNIPEDAYYITRVPLAEVPVYLSAADMGLVTVANFPSKKFCSPTKVGEYLCCGLPYIVTVGTSEDDSYAADYNVGVVVDSFSRADVLKQMPAIDALFNEDKSTLRARCRKVGIEYRGLDNAIETLQEVFDHCYQLGNKK